ncbi:MAG: hypothetical protein A2514_02610 [Gammaproteobacteria bacterium RIFOXYD12_FULL_61_37]|nr:MAG: hypothetical protein A2514_02610 [Gammaproteobacteria bacterium RIFOXYD12_FULL_61_37]
MTAPEPILSAYIHLLGRVVLEVRARSIGPNKMPDDQIFDLMDAIHNVPHMLAQYGSFEDKMMRENYLAPYDEKWGGKERFRLLETLEDAMKQAKNRAAGR